MDRHKEIEQAAYQKYIWRVRYDIPGDDKKDWIEAEIEWDTEQLLKGNVSYGYR